VFSYAEGIYSALKDMADLFTDTLVWGRRVIFEGSTAVLYTRCTGTIEIANDDLL
jgi:hypothetical protein